MIIGITGYKKSAQKQIGKDTVAKMINQLSDNKYRETMFAEPIKKMLCLLTGCTMEQLEDNDFKNTKMPACWNLYKFSCMDRYNIKDMVFTNKEEHKEYLNATTTRMTYREALQYIGTDLFRNQFCPITWINATMSNIKADEDVIITDVRFPNEAEAIKELGGIIIGIKKDRLVGDLHESETAMFDYKGCDFVIDNNGTLEELKDKVKQLIKEL